MNIDKALKSQLGTLFSEAADTIEKHKPMTKGQRIALTTLGSELGIEEMIRGAEIASNEGVDVILVGPGSGSHLACVPADDEKQAHQAMTELLDSGEAAAAVTMHYAFAIGTATVGRVVTPARGRQVFISTTTGTSDTDRVQAMVKNAIYGLACAKACGVEEPSIGILNLEGARQVERALRQMKDAGYPVKFGTSVRSDGGCLLRGNDLLVGSVDVVVTDSLTGNVLMKVLSAFTSGGDYETVGYGYGPGVGRDCDRIVCILSRASGAPVVANALKYAAQVAAGNLLEVASREIDTAIRTGFAGFTRTNTECVITDTAVKRPAGEQSIKSPAPKAVTEEITGIDILELEDAATLLLSTGVYAETGMGCTGPVVLVAVEDKVEALRALKEGGYIE